MGINDRGKCPTCGSPITGKLPRECYNCGETLEEGDLL